MKINLSLTEEQAILVGNLLKFAWNDADGINKTQIEIIVRWIHLELEELKLKRLTNP